jgi:hypothetical protein
MKSYFQNRADQDAAIKILLTSLGNSTHTYPVEFVESIDPSDHEIMVAIICDLVDYWMDEWVFKIRLSGAGRDWLATH